MKSKWFAIEASSESAELSIFDEIGGFGISVAEFKDAFDLVRGKELRLLLNSPGGSVTEGMAIYNLLASERSRLTVEVLGLAASMASVVALAGKELVMDEGSYLMIHNPWTITWGDADQLRKDADVLDKMRGELVNIYASRSTLSAKEIGKLMDDETWMTAEEAKDAGFASSVYRTTRAAARAFTIPRGFKHAPAGLSARPSDGIKTIRDFEGYLRDAGFSRTEAAAIASAGFKAARRDGGSGDDGDTAYVIEALKALTRDITP